MSTSMKVITAPYKAPRRRRTVERQFVVKWIDGSTMYFRHFKLDRSAIHFMNSLIDTGFEARILMK
jgi:hypothetical protein